jgi:hypothetical protein
MQMKKLLAILTLLITTAVYAQPYQPKKETIDALQKVSFLTGSWKGIGWIQMGPQKHTFNQTESIISKVNGTIVQIEGLGRDEKTPDIIIHQALAILSYDNQNGKYLMKAFRGDGGQIDADAQLLDDHTFQWGFSHPTTGEIKYTITVLNNKWTEIGEMSRDGGKTYLKYMEIVLEKL